VTYRIGLGGSAPQQWIILNGRLNGLLKRYEPGLGVTGRWQQQRAEKARSQQPLHEPGTMDPYHVILLLMS
jgi:hypothetical protein